jgi:hypothetical protein
MHPTTNDKIERKKNIRPGGSAIVKNFSLLCNKPDQNALLLIQ